MILLFDLSSVIFLKFKQLLLILEGAKVATIDSPD